MSNVVSFPLPPAPRPVRPVVGEPPVRQIGRVAAVTAVLGLAMLVGAGLSAWRASGSGPAVAETLWTCVRQGAPFLLAVGALASAIALFGGPRSGTARRRRFIRFRRALNRKPWLVPAALAPALFALAFVATSLDGANWFLHGAIVVAAIVFARFVRGRARAVDGASLTATAIFGLLMGYFAPA